MARYTVNDILNFKKRAYELGLKASVRYFNRSAEELTNVCNGVGGEGSRLSNILTWAFWNKQVSASIHDEGYDAGGTEEDRKQLDKDFRDNMITEWVAERGFWRWFKLAAVLERRKINLAYAAVRTLGSAYFKYR